MKWNVQDLEIGQRKLGVILQKTVRCTEDAVEHSKWKKVV